ncbi:NUDIX domain-containing protein [Sediminivirga luteola]|uniref:NUDIX domain-containing protein n=1 Tax=Sediminivirga luteola TaxID=1774748 RepID=UPI001F5A457B|nr:NUDIX hydrolase [Sediminivirga luteola]MCI2265388.1 NUDIX hydrolase [Sediminivirga luteola]
MPEPAEGTPAPEPGLPTGAPGSAGRAGASAVARAAAGAEAAGAGDRETPELVPVLADELVPLPVLRREVVHRSYVWDIVDEEIRLPRQDESFQREYVDHPGAVAVVAVNDRDEVLLIQQYRVPARARLWELPAGLLDIDGEDPAVAARRELEEETDVTCGRLDHLVDLFNTPGGSSETLRIYLARDLSPVPEDRRTERQHEEREIVPRWVPLDEALNAIMAGTLHNAPLLIGLLTAERYRAQGWQGLRGADVPWPSRRLRGQ